MMATVEDLTLYQYEGCAWCAMVHRAAATLGVEIAQRDIFQEPEHLRDLVAATGRQTVPCLRFERGGEEQWMHESGEIIAYLNERFASSR